MGVRESEDVIDALKGVIEYITISEVGIDTLMQRIEELTNAETVPIQSVYNALCEHCASGVAFEDADCWQPFTWHEWWQEGRKVGRTRCGAFEMRRALRPATPPNSPDPKRAVREMTCNADRRHVWTRACLTADEKCPVCGSDATPTELPWA